MKLLDPFAGYRLASGHPFFHAALFTCSWFVSKIGDIDNISIDAIQDAFQVLRWAHLTLIILAACQSALNRPSKIPEIEDNFGEDEDGEKERVLAKTKVIHRDGSYKLFSRVLASVQVFVYQGAVFYAQMTLANALFI